MIPRHPIPGSITTTHIALPTQSDGPGFGGVHNNERAHMWESATRHSGSPRKARSLSSQLPNRPAAAALTAGRRPHHDHPTPYTPHNACITDSLPDHAGCVSAVRIALPPPFHVEKPSFDHWWLANIASIARACGFCFFCAHTCISETRRSMYVVWLM